VEWVPSSEAGASVTINASEAGAKGDKSESERDQTAESEKKRPIAATRRAATGVRSNVVTVWQGRGASCWLLTSEIWIHCLIAFAPRNGR
jgi:hypothetical protein